MFCGREKTRQKLDFFILLLISAFRFYLSFMLRQTTVAIYDPGKEIAGQPSYNQTIRYIFQYIDFAISEDEAAVITNLFIEHWDALSGVSITPQQLKERVYDSCRSNFMVFLSREKIDVVVDLILSYLRSIGQF